MMMTGEDSGMMVVTMAGGGWWGNGGNNGSGRMVHGGWKAKLMLNLQLVGSYRLLRWELGGKRTKSYYCIVHGLYT